MPPLLREWLNALGRRRLLLTLAIAVVLLVVSPTLKANAPDSFDRVLLDGLHQRIPAWLGQLLLVVYQASGIHVTAVLVLAVRGFLAFKRFWPDLVCVVAGTGGILVIVDRLLKPYPNLAHPILVHQRHQIILHHFLLPLLKLFLARAIQTCHKLFHLHPFLQY